MDLNVKLQGLKYNYEKFMGIFVEFRGSSDFQDLWNYFP
jgi:hypothetical protein